jgi:hypothetical protein
MKKSTLLLTLLLLGGLYILGFGIYTLSITHLFFSGLVLTSYGLLISMFVVLVLLDIGGVERR